MRYPCIVAQGGGGPVSHQRGAPRRAHPGYSRSNVPTWVRPVPGPHRGMTPSLHTPICRGTSLLRQRHSLGFYSKPMARVLGGSQGDGRFLMGEVTQ